METVLVSQEIPMITEVTVGGLGFFRIFLFVKSNFRESGKINDQKNIAFALCLKMAIKGIGREITGSSVNQSK